MQFAVVAGFCWLCCWLVPWSRFPFLLPLLFFWRCFVAAASVLRCSAARFCLVCCFSAEAKRLRAAGVRPGDIADHDRLLGSAWAQRSAGGAREQVLVLDRDAERGAVEIKFVDNGSGSERSAGRMGSGSCCDGNAGEGHLEPRELEGRSFWVDADRVTAYSAIDNVRYHDVLSHFTWNRSRKTFTGQVRTSSTVGRMHIARPKHGCDRFFFARSAHAQGGPNKLQRFAHSSKDGPRVRQLRRSSRQLWLAQK